VTRYLPDPSDRQVIAEEIHALVSTHGTETPLCARHYARQTWPACARLPNDFDKRLWAGGADGRLLLDTLGK
jgi:hypothetical protein